MKVFGSIVTLTLFFVLYGVVHSWLARHSVKAWFRQIFGPGADRWYRLAYNVFAVITFMPMFILMAVLPQQVIYVVPAPWRWFMVAGQVAALIGAGITLLQTGPFHFIGLTQLLTERPSETTPLNFRGMYRRVRHPLYFFSLLFLWLSPA
jgi:protein-S-isoprenylcysteine O-methyltransferase Ste14